MEKTSKRIDYLDTLKTIGLICIFIAHVNPPECIFVFRCFDVPMMIIISSILSRFSYEKTIRKGKTLIDFFYNRFKRLILPVWLFLLLYFSGKFLLLTELYDIEYYVCSFLLTRYGIGYVWIFLIYFYCNLMTPFLEKYSFNKKWLCFLILIYIAYEIACSLGIGIQNKVVDTTFYYFVPYSCISFFGFHYYDFDKRTKIKVAFFSLILTFIIGLVLFERNGSFQSFQLFKYPPRLYYLAYGLGMSYLFLLVFECNSSKLFLRFSRFISIRSLELYLCHIIAIDIINYFFTGLNTWYLKLSVIVFVSLLLCKLAEIIEEWLKKLL